MLQRATVRRPGHRLAGPRATDAGGRRVARTLALVSAVVFALGACNDDEETPDSSGSDTATAQDVAAGTDTAGPAPSGCPLAGNWNLQNIRCGAQDITANYFQSIDRTLLTVTGNGVGCDATVTHENGTCREVEQVSMVGLSADTMTVTSAGITSCDPVGCTLAANDDGCQVGDRNGTFTIMWSLDGDDLTTTSARGVCADVGAGDTTAIYQLQ